MKEDGVVSYMYTCNGFNVMSVYRAFKQLSWELSMNQEQTSTFEAILNFTVVCGYDCTGLSSATSISDTKNVDSVAIDSNRWSNSSNARLPDPTRVVSLDNTRFQKTECIMHFLQSRRNKRTLTCDAAICLPDKGINAATAHLVNTLPDFFWACSLLQLPIALR